MKNFKYIKIVAMLLLVAVFVLACESTPDVLGKKGTELSVVKGSWISLGSLLDSRELKADYKKAVADMPFYTEGGYQTAIKESFSCPVLEAKFDGTNTVLLTVLDKDGNKAEKKITYKYVGRQADVNYPDYFWYKFEAVKDVPGLLHAKHFVLMPPHKHGEGLLHWHGRFNGRSFKSAIEYDSSWPTFVLSSTPNETLMNNLKTTIANFKTRLPKSPFEPYMAFGNGYYTSVSAFFANKSPEVEAAYKKVIQKYAGKNPEGGNFTKEWLINAVTEKYGSAQEHLTNIEFVTEGGRNELIFWLGDKKVFQSSYKRIAHAEDSEHDSPIFKADKKGAGIFTYIVMTSAHGSDPKHFHFWYGKTPKVDTVDGYPTCFAGKFTDEQAAERVEKTSSRIIDRIIKK